MKIQKILLLFLLAFGSVHASASDVTVDFRNQVRTLSQGFLDQGVSCMGILCFQDVLDRLDQIQIVEDPATSFPAENGYTRSSAFWNRNGDQMIIHVNGWMWIHGGLAVTKPFIAFHEVLGALGYEDGAYQISSILMVRSNPKTQNLLRKVQIRQLNALVGRQQDPGRNLGGGVVGVGGGGDEGGIGMKYFMMNHAVEELADATTATARDDVFSLIYAETSINIEMRWNRTRE